MDEKSERKKFIETFAVQVQGVMDKKFSEENERMKPIMGELADGYRSFISDLGPGFLEIAENYNVCLEIAKANELIGDIELKARIKDFSSSNINTDDKILDDMFGMEIDTDTDTEKEILMLFNHLIFDISKNKMYNKTNGYVAYHCIGDFSPKNVNIKKWIKDTVNEEKVREYKYSRNEQKNLGKKNKNIVPVFPQLQKFIKKSEKLNEISSSFEEMLEYMNTIDKKLSLPIIDFHFLTKEVRENSIRGNASHSKYKKTDEDLIKNNFKHGQLIRGVNSPLKFEGTCQGLKLQDFYDTLLENWPFLRKIIVKRRKLGKEDEDRNVVSKFDYLSASVFPFLRKYVPNFKYDNEKIEEKWGVLKIAMLVDRLDIKKPLADELVDNGIGDAWRGCN